MDSYMMLIYSLPVLALGLGLFLMWLGPAENDDCSSTSKQPELL